MEKVFEQSLKKPLVAVRKKIGAHIVLLNKKYQKLKKGFKVIHTWDEENDVLRISSPQYGVTSVIKFTKSKIIGYMEIPFLLRTMAWVYKKRLIREVLKELNAFLKKI